MRGRWLRQKKSHRPSLSKLFDDKEAKTLVGWVWCLFGVDGNSIVFGYRDDQKDKKGIKETRPLKRLKE
jgi:hypothetical protein